MTPINNSVQQIAAILRNQVAALRTPAQLARHAGQKGGGTSSGAVNDPKQEDLADVVAQRIQQIARDDPQYKSKAFRIFLEAVIAAEFGESLRNDLRFGKMIDAIQEQMQADPELSTMMDEAVLGLAQSR